MLRKAWLYILAFISGIIVTISVVFGYKKGKNIAKQNEMKDLEDEYEKIDEVAEEILKDNDLADNLNKWTGNKSRAP